MSDNKNDFTFAEIENGFDNHIELSIRGYNNLLNDSIILSKYFVENDTNVVDIGCSSGKMISRMIDTNSFAIDAHYIGIEIAQNFKKQLLDTANKLKQNKHGNFEFLMTDVRDYDFSNCSLVLSIFTLQFMPIKDRKQVVDNIYKGLNKGGAFLFSEKIICESPKLQEMMTFTYYDYKKQNFTADEILVKENTLRSLLKPSSIKEIQDMIMSAGFNECQPFWQNHLFIGFIATK